MKFEKINVHYTSFNLKRIHEQAFESSSRNNTHFMDSWFEHWYWRNRTLFFSWFTQLISASRRIEYFGKVSCPTRSCIQRESHKLTYLSLTIFELNGSPFYNLPNLKTLDLTSRQLSYISSNALNSRERGRFSSIRLGRNNMMIHHLNWSIHEHHWICYLDLSYNQITYLEEQFCTIFECSSKQQDWF